MCHFFLPKSTGQERYRKWRVCIRTNVAERSVSWPLLRYCSEHASSQAMPIDCLLLVLNRRGTDEPMRWRTHNGASRQAKLAGLGEHVISKRYGKRKSAWHKLYHVLGRDKCTCRCLNGYEGIRKKITEYVGVTTGRNLRTVRCIVEPLKKALDDAPSDDRELWRLHVLRNRED